MNILFLCVANSARSQMAEGLAKKILGERANVYSAGSQPNGIVHPFAIQVMKEIGIDISNHTSKSYDSLPAEVFNSLDYVITLCAEENCPILSSQAKKLHWPLSDPASSIENDVSQLKKFQKIRDEIRKKLKDFKEILFH